MYSEKPLDETTGQSAEQQLMKILAEASEIGLTKDSNFMKFVEPAMIYPQPHLLEHMQNQINQYKADKAITRFPFDPPSAEVSMSEAEESPILMGTIMKDMVRHFLYALNYCIQHILVLGGSGTGKTNFLSCLALQAMLHVPVLFFDYQKQDYRHLKRFEAAKNLIVVKPQDLPFNFLQPPEGVNPKAWIVTFVTVLCKYNDLLSGSEAFLIKCLTSLYRDRGIFEGNDKYPTIKEFFEEIDHINVKGNVREKRFKESSLTRLESFIEVIGDAAEHSKGATFGWMSNKSMVIEMASLTEHIARFYSAMMLLGIFMLRIASNTRGNILRNLVIADECKYLVPPGYNSNIGFSPLTSVLAQARETGIGMVFADQTAQLEQALFVNTRLKISFRLGDGEDIEKVARSMSLTQEQKEYIPNMDTGECIVRMPGEDPFVIKTLPINQE